MADHTLRYGITLDGPRWQRPGDARRWLTARFAELCREAEGTDLPLLISELVTNACLYGADPVTARLTLGSTWVRIEVEDGTRLPPRVLQPDEYQVNGRGMLIVDRLSVAWGTEYTSGGKVVWAEVPIAPAGELEGADCR